ncbi:hypothetical protein Fot_25064 [Forsythia ovata]|uniref:Uncharacterized protein n=1 Tax=Forsythia ovata TaxID=205694 RepID=A0ABD1U7Z6_9LAMI
MPRATVHIAYHPTSGGSRGIVNACMPYQNSGVGPRTTVFSTAEVSGDRAIARHMEQVVLAYFTRLSPSNVSTWVGSWRCYHALAFAQFMKRISPRARYIFLRPVPLPGSARQSGKRKAEAKSEEEAFRASASSPPGKYEYINIGSRQDKLDPTVLGKLPPPAANAAALVHKYWTSAFGEAGRERRIDGVVEVG